MAITTLRMPRTASSAVSAALTPHTANARRASLASRSSSTTSTTALQVRAPARSAQQISGLAPAHWRSTTAGAAARRVVVSCSLTDTELVQIVGEDGSLSTKISGGAGVYAVYAGEEQLQYVGLSRKVRSCEGRDLLQRCCRQTRLCPFLTFCSVAALLLKVVASVVNHLQVVPDLCVKVKVAEIPSGDRKEMQDKWQEWVKEHVETAGK